MSETRMSGLGGIGEPSALDARHRKGVSEDPSLIRACREFEAFFIREVLSRSGVASALRGCLFAGSWEGEREATADEEATGIGFGSDLYAEQALDALAKSLASGGCLGLAELLYRQLRGRGSSTGAGEGGSRRGAGDGI